MSEEADYGVLLPSLSERLGSAVGGVLGWISYATMRMGQAGFAERLADRAIDLRRHSRGAIRTLGYIAWLNGRRAGFRGRLIVEGHVATGRFAGKNFYATYEVAAFNEARALELIRRFERDAAPSSLRIDSGSLDHPDPGGEGVLYVLPGRTFYRD